MLGKGLQPCSQERAGQLWFRARTKGEVPWAWRDQLKKGLAAHTSRFLFPVCPQAFDMADIQITQKRNLRVWSVARLSLCVLISRQLSIGWTGMVRHSGVYFCISVSPYRVQADSWERPVEQAVPTSWGALS